MSEPYFFTWSKQTDVPSFTLLEAKGTTLKTREYGKLQDLSSTSFHVSFGHGHPELKRAIQDQLETFPTASPKAKFELKNSVSRKLIEKLDCGEGRLFYTVSGAEAIENALKMVRSKSGKTLIAARAESYHGASVGALSVTGDWRQKGHELLNQHTLRIPEPKDDPDASECRKLIEKYDSDNIAAFCLETITGGNGVLIPPKTWWQGIQQICEDFEIPLILDEVICGFSRTGKDFGLHHYGLKPDFVCLSKSITGGHIPFGAVWVKESHAHYFDDHVLSCGLTNYGHPLGLACTRAVLSLIESASFQQNLSNLINVLEDFSTRLEQKTNVQEVRRIGMLAGIDFHAQNSPQMDAETLYRAGLYAIPQKNRLILAPALTFDPDKLRQSLNSLESLI